MLVLAQAAVGTFGGRDLAGLIFIGLASVGIWAGFLHLEGVTEKVDKPPE